MSQAIRPYTSIQVNAVKREVVFVNSPLPVAVREPQRGAVGLDRGVIHPLASSEGEMFDAPELSKADKIISWHEKKMAKSRRLAEEQGRNFYDSKRYAAHKAAAARVSAYEARVLDDWRHKVATILIRRYDLLGIEELRIAAMTRRGKGKGSKAKRQLNKGMRRVGLSDFRSKLEYRAGLVGAIVAGVNPAYTSQRCHSCGHTAAENRESQAVFRCVKCGHSDNADINAAKNILAAALVQQGGARPGVGASVRPETPKGPADQGPGGSCDEPQTSAA